MIYRILDEFLHNIMHFARFSTKYEWEIAVILQATNNITVEHEFHHKKLYFSQKKNW